MQTIYTVYGGDEKEFEYKYWSKSLKEAKFFAKKNKFYSVCRVVEKRGFESKIEVVFSNIEFNN